MYRFPMGRPLVLILIFFALLLLWDASGLDLVLARMVGAPDGFAWRENWFLVHVMHKGGKHLSWVIFIALLLAIFWPLGFMRRLDRRDRAQLVIATVAALALIAVMKRISHTSCPWSLREFGGAAQYISHWAWGVRDGGGGRCFPAGHASAAFAYLGGYFVWRRTAPAVARGWLVCTLIAGLLFGLAQQWRGAHFMSHTLWTAWLCWVAGYAVDVWMRHGAARPRAPMPCPPANQS